MLAACSDSTVKDRFAGVVVYDDFPETAKGADRSDDFGLPAAFVLSAGFANGQAYQYLDLGEFNPYVPKMYLMVRNGAAVEGQYPIIDTLPDKEDYSPWWQVVEVEVPSDYVANDIKSAASVEKSGYDQTVKMEAVHCPVVNPDAAWISADYAALLNVFWGTGESIPNPNYGYGDDNRTVLTDADATAYDIMLTPVWHKRLRAFCFADDFAGRVPVVLDDDNATMLDLDAIEGRYDPDVFGLFPVFDSAPGDTGYAAAVVQFAAGLDSPDQPGTPADLNPDNLEPVAYVDSPIVMPFDLHRFEVTITNTSGDDNVTLGDGLANVSDGGGLMFAPGEAANDDIAALALDGDASYLQYDFAVFDPFLDTVLSSRDLPSLAVGESTTFVILGHPYFPYLGTAQWVDADDAFTGAPFVALYDDSFAPVATQTEDLTVFASNYLDDNGTIGNHPELTDTVGTITVKLLGGAQ
ncbi:MAG: hypothetical protein EP329_19405 [Deltaproteobacteria bacterium]|nr:MAG: hypothetical protein EP329_19405 [Deltaproteobacteria bacterium]